MTTNTFFTSTLRMVNINVSQKMLKAVRVSQSRMSSAISSKTTSHVHIEVERKFLPSPELRNLLESAEDRTGSHQGQASAVLYFKRLPDRWMRDTYYDTTGNQLEAKGIWIRRRSVQAGLSSKASPPSMCEASQEWEAKIRLDGDYTESAFEELEGEVSVQSLLQNNVPGMQLEHLSVTVDLSTHRKTWVITESKDDNVQQHDEIRVDLDETRFGSAAKDQFIHEVGELELTRDMEVVEAEAKAKSVHARIEARTAMKKTLDEFVARHAALFVCSPKPKGKLSAYFEWKART